MCILEVAYNVAQLQQHSSIGFGAGSRYSKRHSLSKFESLSLEEERAMEGAIEKELTLKSPPDQITAASCIDPCHNHRPSAWLKMSKTRNIRHWAYPPLAVECPMLNA
jgi:hypothetical protein